MSLNLFLNNLHTFFSCIVPYNLRTYMKVEMNWNEKNVNTLLQAQGKGSLNVFSASENGRLGEVSGYVAEKPPPSGLPQDVMSRSSTWESSVFPEGYAHERVSPKTVWSSRRSASHLHSCIISPFIFPLYSSCS